MKVRIHNSIEKNLIFKDRVQDDKRLKPKGLWYGIDNEWLDWCNEMPGWIHQQISGRRADGIFRCTGF